MLLWLCLARGAEWWPEGSRGLFNWNWAGGRGEHSWKRPGCSEKICNVNTSTSAPSALKNLAQKMCKTKMRLKLAQHYAQPIFRGQRNAQGMGKTAFLYYDSWWDTGGIKTETGGIDPPSPCRFNFKAIGRLVSKCQFFVTPTFG